MEDIKVIEALHLPVPPDEIKWRQARYDKPNGYVKMLAYVDARYVMDVLDNVVGSENWQNEYMEIKGRIFCKLTIQLPSGKTVSKMDCGVETDIEAEKGAVSDALKRVAVLFGIGRDLYSMGDHFAETNDRGYVDLNTWETPRSEAIPEKVQIPRTGAKEPTTSALAQSQSDETAVESPPSTSHVPTTESIIASGVKPAYKLPPPIGQDDDGKAFVTVPNMVCYSDPGSYKALLVGEPGAAEKASICIPKSQIEDYPNNPPFESKNDVGPISIPKWLAEKNGLDFVPF